MNIEILGFNDRKTDNVALWIGVEGLVYCACGIYLPLKGYQRIFWARWGSLIPANLQPLTKADTALIRKHAWQLLSPLNRISDGWYYMRFKPDGR